MNGVSKWSASRPRQAIALWLTVMAASVGSGMASQRMPVDETLDGRIADYEPTGDMLLGAAVMLAVLTVFLAAVLPAVVSVLVALTVVATATGWWAVVGQLLAEPSPSESVCALVAVIGAALSLVHCVYFLWRERQARRYGALRPRVTATAAAACRSVLVSCCITIAVTAGLYVAGDAMLSAVATGVILTVVASKLAALTVLPAVVGRFGRRLGWPRLPFVWRLAYRLGPPRLWPLLLRPAVRFPAGTLVASALALLALAIPSLWWHPGDPGGPAVPAAVGEAAQGSASTAGALIAVALPAVLLAFAAMTAVLRSAPAALAVTVPSALAAAAACGLSTLVRWAVKPGQLPGSWGHDTMDAWTWLLSFVLALAVAVPLHRLVVGRILDRVGYAMAAREATARAVTATSDAVTGAAVVMCAVFVLAERMGTVEVSRLSTVLIAAVVVNVTVVRALTLPSMVVLLGGTRWRLRGIPAARDLPLGNGTSSTTDH